MVPLRAVPFRMVCVLGMNDSAFPRQDTGRAFNVMFDAPRLGDRNTRDDDRLLFLQALTAARDAFYISYIGQDVNTGEELPPSPIVGETLEFLRRHYFDGHDKKAFEARLIHHQPMQPFSLRYFSPDEPDNRVFTYAGDWRDATRAAIGAREARLPMLDDSTAPVAETVEAIDLDTLKRFFDHPARAFFRERIKLNLEIEDHQVDDAEPIALGPLAAAQLRERLFASADKAEATAIDLAPTALERARGTLPPPPLADPNYAAEAEAVNELLPIWQAWKAEGTPETLDIQLDRMTWPACASPAAWPSAGRTPCAGCAPASSRRDSACATGSIIWPWWPPATIWRWKWPASRPTRKPPNASNTPAGSTPTPPAPSWRISYNAISTARPGRCPTTRIWTTATTRSRTRPSTT